MSNSLLYPRYPDRICWGCGRYCPAHDLACREDRVPHPIEPFGYETRDAAIEWGPEVESHDTNVDARSLTSPASKSAQRAFPSMTPPVASCGNIRQARC